ncbi:MAG TPA: trypsin-like peptidase domain-containing protein [Phycisphaerae bacterium]|nr:trypsin-like peptidase domain-containing protein [Phycisphaerae bacterium]HRY68700.1 trypsin-like peptidase domain-containing protein [Phycisphaerae bacterium]HSA25526.1 trypsin-like peptidase domain-containing protein [Phycisphaerae bacterium]
MTTLAALLTGLAMMALPGNPATDPADALRAEQDAFRRAVARVAPCVVTIETIGGTQPGRRQPTSGPAFGGREAAPPGFIVADGPTTGLIWSADGLILTSAFNFVRDPSLITVVLSDRRRFVGELIARDEVRRLAMVRVPATGLPVPQWVGDEGEVRVGQRVLALGRGFGGPFCSITAGIVSGLNRMSGLAIQTDARLSPASFGGPLIDLDGRVIGLCVPFGMGNDLLSGVEWYDSGIGFAIPAWQVRASGTDLSTGHSLRRGMLGVVLDAKGNAPPTIRLLADRSPALRAGLKAGDAIVAIDGKPVTAYSDLTRLMRSRCAGQWVKVRVRRGAQEVDLEVVLAVPEDVGSLNPPASEPAGP